MALIALKCPYPPYMFVIRPHSGRKQTKKRQQVYVLRASRLKVAKGIGVCMLRPTP